MTSFSASLQTQIYPAALTNGVRKGNEDSVQEQLKTIGKNAWYSSMWTAHQSNHAFTDPSMLTSPPHSQLLFLHPSDVKEFHLI